MIEERSAQLAATCERVGNKYMERINTSKSLGFVGVAMLATATGAVAIGAVAIGALAIARLAIRRLSVESARLRSLEIEDLTVTRLHVPEVMVSDSLKLPAGSRNISGRDICNRCGIDQQVAEGESHVERIEDVCGSPSGSSAHGDVRRDHSSRVANGKFPLGTPTIRFDKISGALVMHTPGSILSCLWSCFDMLTKRPSLHFGSGWLDRGHQ